MPFLRLAFCAALLAFATTSFGQPAPDAASLVKEGNALARSGLYHAALLRYREAAAAGVDSPLYHYNLGVVYFRLGRFDEAVEELAVARSDPALAPLATYNLALTQLERGDEAAAALAFQQVIDLGAQRTLRRAARDALASLATDGELDRRRAEAEAADTQRRLSFRQGDEGPGEFRVRALARYAQDSNVYRAPSQPYIDFADPSLPLVTPVVHSASFMPVDILAAYVLQNEAEDTEFVFGYTLNGDFYDTEFSNADRISQRFSIGANIDMRAREGRRRRLDSKFYIRTHDETSFNPDDGADRAFDGTGLAERFAYRGAGIAADYAHEMGRFTFGFDVNYERRQYEDAGLLPNYDHDFFENYGFFEFALNSRTDLGLGLMRFRRVYDERRARDLSGAFAAPTDTLEYDYRGVELSARRTIGTTLSLRFELMRLERADLFLGYYDYVQDVGRIGLTYQPNPRLRLTAGVARHSYDYPNAFAYNNPLAGRRTLDTNRIDLEGEYALTGRLALWIALEAEDSGATDLREQYDRSIATIGVKWRRN